MSSRRLPEIDGMPPLTPADRGLIVRYMVLRALTRLGLGAGARPASARPAGRRPRRRTLPRRIHGR